MEPVTVTEITTNGSRMVESENLIVGQLSNNSESPMEVSFPLIVKVVERRMMYMTLLRQIK